MKLDVVLWAVIALTAAPAAAQGLADCPLRDAPFSIGSPIIDILLSPSARTVMDKHLPDVLKGFPATFTNIRPPSFAAILTLQEASSFKGAASGSLDKLDRELRRVPVTRADKVSRCARYDGGPPPKLSIPAGKPRLLLFEKINGFRDGPSVDAAHSAFVAMAARNRWAVVTTDKGSAFTPAVLKQFDVVIWNNISGDVLTRSQRLAFQRYMKNGGGFIGVHGSAGDPHYFWDWYVDTLIGARFAGHPMAPQFQNARVRVSESSHPIAQGLPSEWDMNDEWYSFKNNPRATGSRVIATLDESTYKLVGLPGQKLRMGDDHPIVWTRCVGRGRMFYSAIGHRPERYEDEYYVKMLERAVAWAAGRQSNECREKK